MASVVDSLAAGPGGGPAPCHPVVFQNTGMSILKDEASQCACWVPQGGAEGAQGGSQTGGGLLRALASSCLAPPALPKPWAGGRWGQPGGGKAQAQVAPWRRRRRRAKPWLLAGWLAWAVASLALK